MASSSKQSLWLKKPPSDKPRKDPIIVRQSSIKAVVFVAFAVLALYILVASFWTITGSY